MTRPLIVNYRPEQYTSEHRTYVVLGAPRGGTSMIAGALQILGIPMGSVDDKHEDPVFHDAGNVDQMVETIALRNRNLKLWGWKLPNTIYYYDQIAEHIRNPVFMVIHRNPFDIFMSSSSKDGDGLNDPHFNAPVYHYARMHQLIHDHATVPAYLMSYEAACRDPDRFVEDLRTILPTAPSSRAIDQCRTFIDTGKGYSPIVAGWEKVILQHLRR